MNKKKIAIFGGAFNPPHHGHAQVLNLVSKHFDGDEIWVMPSADRHDKRIPISGEDRIRMIELMIEDSLKDSKLPIIPSHFELKLNTDTVTYETLLALKKEYPDDEFHFIMSSEVVPHMKESWIKGKELFNEGSFIFVERPGSHDIDGLDLPERSLVIKGDGLIDMSSTFVRNLKDQSALAEHTSPKVAEYIRSKAFYPAID